MSKFSSSAAAWSSWSVETRRYLHLPYSFLMIVPPAAGGKLRSSRRHIRPTDASKLSRAHHTPLGRPPDVWSREDVCCVDYVMAANILEKLVQQGWPMSP